MIKASLIGLLVVACGGGCSGSLAAPKADGSSDAGLVCPSVDTGSYCQPWAALLATPSCRSYELTGPAQFASDSYTDCGPYHVHQVSHVDTFEAYYYDMTTGACVAAYSGNGGGIGGGIGAPALCSAGPPAGITGPCAPGGIGPWTPTTGICAADGGGRGGGGAGGGGGGAGVGGSGG
jgi:hypothetical protein